MVTPLESTEEDKTGVQARFQNWSHGLKILLLQPFFNPFSQRAIGLRPPMGGTWFQSVMGGCDCTRDSSRLERC